MKFTHSLSGHNTMKSFFFTFLSHIAHIITNLCNVEYLFKQKLLYFLYVQHLYVKQNMSLSKLIISYTDRLNLQLGEKQNVERTRTGTGTEQISIKPLSLCNYVTVCSVCVQSWNHAGCFSAYCHPELAARCFHSETTPLQ